MIETGKFAGKTYRQWREMLELRITEKEHDLAETQALLDRAASGARVDQTELHQAQIRVRDLRRKIEHDRTDLSELQRSRE